MEEHDSQVPWRVALLVIDVQNDFTEGGPFPYAEGNDAMANLIGRYVAEARDRYDVVVSTQDWHIDPGSHFDKHSVHCVAGTAGADLDPELSRGAGVEIDTLIDYALKKGHFDADYSGFFSVAEDGRELDDILRAERVARIEVCGFAQDVCVAATVRDSLRLGYSTTLLTDLSQPTTHQAGVAIRAALESEGAALRCAAGPTDHSH